MASVLYRMGDIFEQRSDLVVLPCSAKSHVSPSAEVHINRFGLPFPSEKKLGEIEVKRFPGPGKITRYIAWAASVMEYESTPEIIRSIGQHLGQYANENKEIQLIESPLLGTGAGGLDALEAGPALSDGFLASCNTDATLFIFTQHNTIIKKLRAMVYTSSDEQIAPTNTKAPTAFISYSWDSDNHKQWVRDLSTRLRSNGVDVKLDQWHAVPGDQLPHFMEREIRENDYVLIVCTPNYKHKSDNRAGGVGYEGDIMTAEVFTSRNNRKFIPILARGTKEDAIPSWLKGKYFVDLCSESTFNHGYNDLLITIHGTRPQAPPLGPIPIVAQHVVQAAPLINEQSRTEPIRILGVLINEVTEPRLDGSQGSGLYRVPFRLSRPPSKLWAELFLQIWDHPPRFSTMHRPGIASVTDDKIILDGTTIEEVEKYHRDTLASCVKIANQEEEHALKRRQQDEEQNRRNAEDHRKKIDEVSRRLKFDDI